jgi:hypothetical protein
LDAPVDEGDVEGDEGPAVAHAERIETDIASADNGKTDRVNGRHFDMSSVPF